MKDTRPVNLQIYTMKFPVTAICSILHRAAGVFLFLMIPLILLSLKYSLASAADFASVQSIFSCALSKVILWLLLSALVYHFFAGVRHLLMDIGLGESLIAGKLSAWCVMFISILLFILMGVWLWA